MAVSAAQAVLHGDLVADRVLARARHVVDARQLDVGRDGAAGRDADVVLGPRGGALVEAAGVGDRLAVAAHVEEVLLDAREGGLPAEDVDVLGGVVAVA